MYKWMRRVSVLGNLTLAGLGSLFGHLIATWFGPVSIVILYFFSSMLICNMAIVGLLREPFNKNMRVGTMVIVVAVILSPVVGPTTQEGQNFMDLMDHWYAQVWFSFLLTTTAVTGVFLFVGITRYNARNRQIIMLPWRQQQLLSAQSR